ncbi:hypothetical protein AAFF_G00384700 [Aldrovandia affinis]|uniref:Uncharacterized protein n=1 Tax=Aldrovandia affinis TaxID=143900 RepID=A0AAD7R4E7_9TELE|nr:hypothetical protein AAFF_G00384700 [Aldrovandia affinis]
MVMSRNGPLDFASPALVYDDEAQQANVTVGQFHQGRGVQNSPQQSVSCSLLFGLCLWVLLETRACTCVVVMAIRVSQGPGAGLRDDVTAYQRLATPTPRLTGSSTVLL